MRSQSKCSPGPWEQAEGDFASIVDKNGMSVAVTAYSCTTINGRADYSEMEANAALLAAAPDLLWVVQEILECRYEADKMLCIIERQGKAAIAKAKGGTP